MRSVTQNKKVSMIADQCLSGRLRLINRMINSIYDRALRPYNLKASQLNILVAVGYSGGATSKEICSMLQMDTSTFSRTLTRLKNNGWLRSEPSGEGKILDVSITQEGLEKIEEIFPSWEKAQKEADKLLGTAAVKAICDAGTKQLMNR